MFQFLKIYKGLPRNVYILFLVQFINRFGDFVVPFLSLYLISKLGFTSKTAGILVTCAVLVQVPGSMLGGIIADHWSRKGTYIIAQTMAALCILMCAFTNEKVLIISLLLLSTFCSSSVKPLLNTMVFDLLEPEKRKLGYSLLYLGTNLGVSMGPLLAGFLFNHYLKLFFIGDALTSFIAVSLVLFNIKDIKRTGKKSAKEIINTKSFITQMIKNPQFSLFFIIYMTYSFIYVQNSFSLPLTLKNLFNEKGTIYYGYIMSINAVTVVLSTAAMTHLTRRKSSLINISIAGIFYAIGFGSIGIANNFFIFIFSTILWTIGEILISTNCGIYVVNLSNENIRARCTALMMIINSAGKGLGVSTMGSFIENFGISTVWPFIMILAFVTSICTYLFSVYIGNLNRKKAVPKLD